jgi:glycosyltransferase involved in cell wall biosynthesis
MKFSIITPSYKQVEHLRRCALSVADQEGEFITEHLVQDGLSGASFDKWAAQQRFAQCVSELDRGMYDAINRGFTRARGEILAWLNCDEQYLPHALEKVAHFFDSNPTVDILFGDIVIVSSDGIPIGYRQAVKPLLGYIRSCFLSTFSAATFVRRKIIDDGHLLDTNFLAISDAVWIDELLRSGYRCAVLNQPLAVFTQTGENLGQSTVSAEEGLKWRAITGMHGKLRKFFWSAIHRLRKMLAGAYRRRSIQVSIYHGDDSFRKDSSGLVSERWKATINPR